MNPDIPKYGDVLTDDGKATIEFHTFLENLARQVDTVEESTTVISGAWEALTTVTLSGATFEYTWDESLYAGIRIVFDGVQPSVDAESLYCIVGSANGATMYNSANDYDGSEKLYESATWSALSETDQVRLAPSWSTATDEVGSGEVELLALENTALGCLIKIDLLYINSSSNQRANQVQAFLEQSAAIDTVRLFWTSGNFAAGTVIVYGLNK